MAWEPKSNLEMALETRVYHGKWPSIQNKAKQNGMELDAILASLDI